MNFDRLRQLLIQKAIEGKLVPQLDTEPAVQQIGTPPSNTPFEIPRKWKWFSLGDCLTLRSGDGLSKKDYCLGKIPVYGGNGINGYHNAANVTQKTIVIGRVGFYCGNVRLTDGAAWVTDNALIVNFKINVDLDFMVFLLSALNLGKKTSQTAQPVITGKIIKKLIAPIPPIAEQHRIVARLNELLAVIKQAEDAYTDLQSLGKTLRERILQKAIEGKLVPQLDEEPAVEQIGEIPVSIPFNIPSKWSWYSFSDVIQLISGRDLPSDVLSDTKGACAYITGASQLIDGKVVINRWTDAPCAFSEKEDLLIVCKGSGVGKLAVNNYGTAHIARQIMALRCKENVTPAYLFFAVSSLVEGILQSTHGVIPGLSRSDILKQHLPVPPLAEQRRIVAKLNELLPLVDQMTAV